MKNSYSVIKIDWCIKALHIAEDFHFFIRCILKLLPLQGASLIDIIPRALPWAKSFCPFRACCLYGLLDLLGVCLYGVWGPSGRAAYMGCLAFRACCLYGLLGLQGVLLWVAWPSGRAAVGCLTFRACCCGLLALQGVLLWAAWPSGRCCLYGLLPFTFALPFGQRFSIPLRAGDRWFRAWCFNFSKIISASVIVCTDICAKITLYSYLCFYIFYIIAAKKKKWTNKIAYGRCSKGLQFIKRKYWAKENCCF